MSYESVYNRINWINEPSTDTPINEDNLNLMDYAIKVHDDRIIELKADVETLEGYETRAAESAAEAALSEANAKTSETNAKTSETNAATSETNAKTSETNAKASEEASALSEVNAKASETNAKASETNAKESEENAMASEEAAAESATSADNSASRASSYAINSARSAADSKTYMEASQSSATDSENSANDSEAWAVGQRDGVDVDTTDVTYHNNSKYYAEQSGVYSAEAIEAYENALDVEAEIVKKMSLGQFSVNEDGYLVYTDGSTYNFTIDTNGYLNVEVA